MTRSTQAQRAAWMAQWRSAEVALARIRVAELSRVDLARVASDLESASLAAAPIRAASADSGLIEQQRIFRRARPK